MAGLEDTLNNKNEKNEKLNQNPEVQESFESAEDMQKRLSQEMTSQNELLKNEDRKIETANDSIGLSDEEVQEEKTAINLDSEISNINKEADALTNESKQNLNKNETGPEKNGVDYIFEQNPELEKIGTKEEYQRYIENIFPESRVKDILYHYSSHDKIKEEGFKFFTETGVPAGAGEIEAIWLTKKSGNYWGSNDLSKYAVVVNAAKPLDARNSLSEDDEVVKEYNRIWEIGTEKEYAYFDNTKKWDLQKNRKLAFKEAGYDSILTPNLDEVTIFDKENIHILGSKSDVEKFKEFVNKNEVGMSVEKMNNLNPQLLEIGTPEQYTEYLQTRFPEKITRELGEGYVQTGINEFLESKEDLNENEKRLKGFLEHYITQTTNEEFESFKPYKTSEYYTINSLLREGKEITVENILQYKNVDPSYGWAQEEIVEAVKNLKEAMKKSFWSVDGSLVNNKKTYRADFTGYHANKNIGDVVEDKAFMSTSVTKDGYAQSTLRDEKDATILVMNFPKNSIVNSVFLNGAENELLLPPNMSYEVKNKKQIQKNGATKTILQVEFLPNEYIHVLGSEKDIGDFKNFVTTKNTK